MSYFLNLLESFSELRVVGESDNRLSVAQSLVRQAPKMVVMLGNVYQMLKDHDLQVQEAVRRGHVDKAKVRKVDMEGNQLTTNLLFVSSCYAGSSNPMRPSLVKLLLLFLAIGFVESTGALKFAFDGFNTSKLLLYGNAKLDSGAISLTQDTTFSIGRALYHAKIPLKHANSSTVRSFETFFTFSITPYKGQCPSHGLVFIFVPSAGIQGAAASQYLGFLNRTNDGNMNNNVFGIDRKITAEMRPSLVKKITAELG